MDWALALSEDVEWTEEEQIIIGDPNLKSRQQGTNVWQSEEEPSSDVMSTSQAFIPATKTTFQEIPLMGRAS